MRDLFDETAVNGLKLSNRFVRSATWEGMAGQGGEVTPKLIDTMVDLAQGGVGLIISSHSYVTPEGQAGPWQIGIHEDDLIEGLQRMTSAVHNAGGKMIVQLAHAGTFASEKLTGLIPVAVSNFDGLSKSPRKELAADDIAGLAKAFADAAQRAKAAGFDGVQIHSAHGYLLSQFLSPKFNRRQDEYGGDIRNRSRVHVDIVKAIRKAVGDDYPIFVKINCRDFAENGLETNDSLYTVKLMADAGLDAIELSGGLLTSGKLSPSRMGINAPEKEAYFREDAARFKKEIDLPLILVGGNRSYEVADSLIKEDAADYISMSRPLIREPGLIKRWRDGDRSPSKCLSDNLCFGPAMEGKGIYCVTEERGK